MEITVSLPDPLGERLRAEADRKGTSVDALVGETLTAAIAPAQRRSRADTADRVRAVQSYFAQFKTDVLASEELIAERRLEAWRETVEEHEWAAKRAQLRDL